MPPRKTTAKKAAKAAPTKATPRKANGQRNETVLAEVVVPLKAPVKTLAPPERTRRATGRKRTAKAGVLHTPSTKSYAGILDTKEGVVYTNIALDATAARRRRQGYTSPSEIVIFGQDDFVQWLNKIEGEERFITCRVVSAYEVQPTGGINNLYEKFLAERKDLRIKAALEEVEMTMGFGFSSRNSYTGKPNSPGEWRFTNYDPSTYIASVANGAKISTTEARDAIYDYLKDKMGDFVDRLRFPSAEEAAQIKLEAMRY